MGTQRKFISRLKINGNFDFGYSLTKQINQSITLYTQSLKSFILSRYNLLNSALKNPFGPARTSPDIFETAFFI